MADVYMYADETGDLDMSGSVKASKYFGFGTAVFPDGHGNRLWEGLQLRCQLEAKGVRLPRGFHAKNDSHSTRAGYAQVGDRIIVPCIWDAPSSWGIQVADYALWAVQRQLEGRTGKWLDTCVEPTLRSIFMPWGKA